MMESVHVTPESAPNIGVQEFMDKDNNARDDVIERVKNKAH